MIVKMRNVRLAFHDLFKAKSINNGAPKYSGVFIIGEDSVCSYEIDDKERKGVSLSDSLDDSKSVLHRIIAKVVKEKWGDLGLGAKKKIKIWCLNKADGSTTREAYTNDEDEYYNGFDENSWFVTAAKLEDKVPNTGLPVYDQGRNIANGSQVFSGCYVNAIIDVYAIEKDDGRSVCASLEGVQLLRRGENLGGGTRIDAHSAFDDEEYETDDAFGSDDDVSDVPF